MPWGMRCKGRRRGGPQNFMKNVRNERGRRREPAAADARTEAGEVQWLIDARVFDLVRAVPAGRVASYGQVGAACDPPISGYICGRILGRAGADVPWWRIVA